MTNSACHSSAPVQVVWFKRDLRTTDHPPLAKAARAGAVLPLYIHEPSLVGAEDYSRQHSGFLRECLDSLNVQLQARGARLVEEVGEAVEVFERVWQSTRFTTLWCHQETTNAAAFERDRKVIQWCKAKGVTLQEVPHNAVLRGQAYRDQAHEWNQHFRLELFEKPLVAPTNLVLAQYVSTLQSVPLGQGKDKAGRMCGGRQQADRLLENFLSNKLLGYRDAISSPLSAVHGCSRLSPFLALGVVSMREVALAMNRQHTKAEASNDAQYLERVEDALQFYVERLYWRSAYMQQFEIDSSLEFVSQHAGTRGLREDEFNESLFLKWKAAETGYPFIDAGLRMLAQTGWINMRLRGTLISFAVNELWLHWREPALFLAREFLDYEPGIHYSQMQIHAGTSRGTTPLMYNPVKQAQDHDPWGKFVRQWVPELARVPNEFIFEPWKMTRADQAGCGTYIGRDYPLPLVPYEAAGHAARMLVSAAREHRPAPALAYTRQRLELLRSQRQGDLF